MSPAPASRPCRAFLGDFSAFVDGQLPHDRRDELQAHVDCCQGCLDHLTAYRRGITVLRSIDAGTPADFWERLERRLWPGHELTVHQGGREAGLTPRAGRWPGAAVTVAAAAVLALFLIARGLGPESRTGTVGPRSVRASVAVTLPVVPETEAPVASARRDAPSAAPRSSPRGAVASASLEPDDQASPGAAEAASREGELERLREQLFEGPLSRASSALVLDGWVEPVRLGRGWSRPGRGPASLIRAAAAVTPAPWNVDRAVSLP